MTVKITPDQKLASTGYATDTDDAYENGIKDSADLVVSPAIVGYPPSTPFDIVDTVKNAAKQQYALLARYFQPLAGHTHSATPNFSTSILETQIGSLNISTFIARPVVVSLSLSAVSSSIDTVVSFYIKMNGVQVSPPLPFIFNAASVHASMSGSWMVQLPAQEAASVITAHILRTSGAGVITVGTNDYVSMTLIG